MIKIIDFIRVIDINTFNFNYNFIYNSILILYKEKQLI